MIEGTNGKGAIMSWARIHAEQVYARLTVKGRTPQHYLQYMNPDHLLARQIETRIKGTHTHSVIVADVAAAPAFTIGANADLLRVAAIFHDVDKLNHPQLFQEAYRGSREKSVVITTEEEFQVILNHSLKSAAMLREMGFPPEVCEVVSQHHGNRKARPQFSPELAKRLEGKPPEYFQYPCSRPTTKEAAILMLADSCEAFFNGKIHKPGESGPSREIIRTDIMRIFIELRDGRVEGDPRRDMPQFAEVPDFTAAQWEKLIDKMVWMFFRHYNNYPTITTATTENAPGAPTNGRHGLRTDKDRA